MRRPANDNRRDGPTFGVWVLLIGAGLAGLAGLAWSILAGG